MVGEIKNQKKKIEPVKKENKITQNGIQRTFS